MGKYSYIWNKTGATLFLHWNLHLKEPNCVNYIFTNHSATQFFNILGYSDNHSIQYVIY
jgi:hypothetical protein